MLLALYTLGVLAILFRAGSPDALWWWAGILPFVLWAVSPVAFLCLLNKSERTLLVGAVGISIWGIVSYLEAMFGEGARSTSALIFLFMPGYQWVVALLVFVVGLILSALSKSTE